LIIGIILGFIGLVALLCAAAVGLYYSSLSPVDSSNKDRVRISIASGTAPSSIAEQLHEKGLIKSTLAFDIYTRLSGTRNKLQAGTYSLSPSESVQGVVEHLVSGKTDQITITFYPGATLRDHTDKPASKKTDVETVLLKAGYAQAEIDAALSKTYEHPLFADKPAGTDLEGYVFGETYVFGSEASVEEILKGVFDEYYKQIQAHDLVSAFQQQGLTLYEGITLASIIQREVSGQADSRQVAQIFFKRLREGMPLGADATFVYAANKAGVAPTVDLDSPYNTRIHAGLPPGPISAPGLAALQGVAQPAEGDYLYFVSGDDGKNYYSRTAEEHEANTRAHCKINCSLF
jgi:UPF0755 protein